MPEIRLRHRARMREKDLRRMNDALAERLGAADAIPADAERARAGDFDVIVANGLIIAIIYPGEEDRVMLTPRGLLRVKATRGYVTVDMGAIKFVTNGADVMAPGITEADPGIAVGDLVWIRDERNGQPLAIGEALIPGTEMPRGARGKAVKSLHFVGDDLWNASS